jgi:transposase InsO family protein
MWRSRCGNRFGPDLPGSASSPPGKPVQNAWVEGFDGRFLDECLNEQWFVSLADARRVVEQWRPDYNRHRPQSALGYRAPEEFRHSLLAPIGPPRQPIGLSH